CRARRSVQKPFSYSSRTMLLAPVACIVLTLHAGPSFAQSGPPPVWVPFDGSSPGTPADIVLDAANSTPASTRFDVFIHGLWRTERVGAGGAVYQQISVPGLQSVYAVGAPELPVYRFDLGIVTGAAQATFDEVTVFSEQVIPGILPWPHPIE